MRGTCDVVVFPSIWSETKDMWQLEQILVVSGKVDSSRRDEPSLLCSWVKRPDDVTVASKPSSRGANREASPPPAPPPRYAEPVESPPQPAKPARTRPRTVHVTLARSPEQAQDKQTLRQVHDLLTARDGPDCFVIRLSGGSNGEVELRFPNKATSCSPELLAELEALVGEDAVQVREGIS
jgi:DNA polymerase III alpha subunit